MASAGKSRSHIIGFAVQPAQSLSQVDTRDLHSDITSLLFSVTYHPEHVAKVTLDLRYLARHDSSLVAKALDIVVLARIDLEESTTASQADDTLERFRKSLYDLLSLHLVRYEFGIIPLTSDEVTKYLSPFEILSVVEITRRITGTRPFAMTSFDGGSPMTRVVDMLLREDGQCFLSVSLEPHLLTDEQVRDLEVFGYQSPVLPGPKEEELIKSILNLEEIKQSMQSVFRMKIRLASDKSVSQYVVNLVGSEISGQRDFYYFSPPDKDSFDAEVRSLQVMEYCSALQEVVNLDLPSILLDLVYLYRPDEAVSAFRLPTQRISVAQEKAYKTYPAPVRFLPNRGLQIGTATHPSYSGHLPVYATPEDRARHVYIIGKTGTGKSYELLNMIRQDVRDQGLCVIDPHGDLVKAIVPLIPEGRINDVFYFDPADEEYAMGFNFLEPPPGKDGLEREVARDYIVQEVVSMLLRFVDYDLQMFGPIAQQWTRNGCMTLMELDPPGTLVDFPNLFSNNDYRRWAVRQVSSPILRAWWKEWEMYDPKWKNEVLSYVTSKYTPMISAPQVRNVVGQVRSAFNFESIMNDRKILLVNLASGQIGKINSHLLGSMFVSRLLWTALGRAKDPAASRRQFFLYVDEFQNFITDSFEQILSEARKYGLSLTIAHQHLDQLRAMGRMGNKLERAVFGNVGTIVCFRVGGDAGYLAGELGHPADASSLKNLPNRYAVVTLQVEGVPSMPFTMKTVEWVSPSETMIRHGEIVRERARKRGRRIEDVVGEINARFEVGTYAEQPSVR